MDCFDTNGNEATVNVRAEYSDGAWSLAEGSSCCRHQLSASTSDNAIVGDDSSQEIVMEAGTGTDFLAAGAGSDNYLLMAGSTGGSSTAILESTTAENIRDAFYNNSDLSLSDEDSIQLREQYNILDVDFARVGSGRGLNLNTLQITSENEDGSVDVFDVVGQYSSFGTSSVEYLVLAPAGKVMVKLTE